MSISDLVQPRHLKKAAVIYVRQSTPQQVINNQESLRLQYAMRTRVMELGWHEDDTEVVDSDLGVTASDINGREGYQQLAARIALGEVGVIVAYDATRLARNCTHWYQLLDLCGRADCLIADRDGVYDATSINGRLLLGLKGQISELELHTLKARLTAGILSKAQRGELALALPAGLQRQETGQVVKYPDASVQRVISLVFETVLRTRTAAGTARLLKQEAIRLPARNRFGDIQWRDATAAAVRGIVKNPAYAGAFVYGRTRTTRLETGRKVVTTLPIDEWRISVRDKYPAYVSWETYERIQTMLKDNGYQNTGTRGAPRVGRALLQGILYCGKCGHKIAGRERREIVYCCRALAQQRGEPMCQSVDADSVDRHVLKQFFAALSVAEIDLSVEALSEADNQREQLLTARRDEIARYEYHEQLARRQFDLADPDNRLVTGELEQRWESALRDLEDSRIRLEEQLRTPQWTIPAELREALADSGPNLSAIWDQGLLTSVQMKTLLRTMIGKVVLHRVDDETVHLRIVWRGGATTQEDISARRKYHRFDDMPGASKAKSLIVELARAGHDDQEIVRRLTQQGYRGPRTETFTVGQVQRIRLDHGIRHRSTQPPHRDGFLTVKELSLELNLSTKWIYARIADGTLKPGKTPGFAHHVFPNHCKTLQLVKDLAESTGAPPRLTCGKAKSAPLCEP